MKKKISITILLIVLLVFPIIAKADCASDFEAIASGFKVSYVYNSENDDFTLTFVNPDYTRYGYMYMAMEEINRLQRSSHDTTMTAILDNFKGDEYTYSIIGLYNECRKVKVKTETIKLKKYNPYADDPACVGNEDFVLCQKEYDKAVDEATFRSRLETYLEEKQGNNNTTTGGTQKNNSSKNNKNNSNNGNVIDNIKEYASDNTATIIIIVLVVLALAAGATLIILKTLKSRRLE